MPSETRQNRIIEIFLTQPSLTEANIRRGLRVFFALALMLMFILRVVYLDSDAYPRLSWSSALMTDEGFYIHNARNLILFGKERTDDFNNVLIMPVLHWVQFCVFRIFGVGAVQARSISVVLSLLTLPLFFDLMHRAFRWRVAFVATVFLGFDHIYALYNRMALMDTPACAFLICSIYALIRGVQELQAKSLEKRDGSDPLSVDEALTRTNWARFKIKWLLLSGALFVLTFTVRGLIGLFLPAFLASLYAGLHGLSFPRRLMALFAFLGGVALAGIAYALLWYAPHYHEIVRVNRYYIQELLLPHTSAHFQKNLTVGLFDYPRGMMPYLFRHSTAAFCLALLGVVSLISESLLKLNLHKRIPHWIRHDAPEPREYWDGKTPDQMRDMLSPAGKTTLCFFGLSLLISWLFLCCVDYAPSRYYMMFYPSMMGIAGYCLFQIPKMVYKLWRHRLFMALTSSFLFCLLAQSFRAKTDYISANDMSYLFFGVFVAFLAGSFLYKGSGDNTHDLNRYDDWMKRSGEVAAFGAVVWCGLNIYWTADWLNTMTWRQREQDRRLQETLPPNSTLIGAVAPGLCLNNRFKCVNVIERLCNDDHPVERAESPAYIVILDDKWKEEWWVKHYPELVETHRRKIKITGLLRSFFTIGVYPKDKESR